MQKAARVSDDDSRPAQRGGKFLAPKKEVKGAVGPMLAGAPSADPLPTSDGHRGSKLVAVSAGGVARELHEYIWRSRDRFARFVRLHFVKCRRFPSSLLRGATAENQLWPAPPPVTPAQAGLMPSRQQRKMSPRRGLSNLLLLLLFASSSFIALGEPSRTREEECPGCWGDGRMQDRLTPLQRRAARDRGTDIDDFLLECEALREWPVKAVAAAEVLSSLGDEYDSGCNPDVGLPLQPKKGAKALPLDAARMSKPNVGATHRLVNHLSPFLALAQHRPHLMNKVPVPQPVPRPKMHGTPAQSLAYLKGLHESLMTALIPEEMVPLDGEGRTVPAAGAFGVYKTAERDRAITNRRGRNNSQLTIGSALLPHGSQFTLIRLSPSQVLRVSLDDLPDYFHKLREELGAASLSHIGRSYTARELRAAGVSVPAHFSDSRRLRFILLAVPMGGVHALDWAQDFHEGLLAGTLKFSELLHYGKPLRLRSTEEPDTYSGLYVDDNACVGAVDREVAKVGGPAADTMRMDRCCRAYKSEDMAPKEEKRVRGQVNGGCAWGAQIQGEAGHVGDKIVRRWANLCLTAHLLNRRTCSLALARTLVGTWTCSMLYRRPTMAIFDAAHREMSNWGPCEVKPLPWRLSEELAMCCVFAPHMRTNTRAVVKPEVVYTDASLRAGMITKAAVPQTVADELHDWQDIRGERTWLRAHSVELRSTKGILRDVKLNAVEKAFCELTEALQHQGVLSYRFARREHINMLETNVVKTLVKLLSGSEEEWLTRRALGLDSRVARGAKSKGRSPSFRLNKILKQMMPYEIAAELYFGSYFIPSESNPADDGTRTRATRAGGATTERIERVLRGEEALLPEEDIQNKFVRGLPRGGAATALMTEFETSEELLNYLDAARCMAPVPALPLPPTDNVNPTSRRRCKSLGRRGAGQVSCLLLCGSKQRFPLRAVAQRNVETTVWKLPEGCDPKEQLRAERLATSAAAQVVIVLRSVDESVGTSSFWQKIGESCLQHGRALYWRRPPGCRELSWERNLARLDQSEHRHDNTLVHLPMWMRGSEIESKVVRVLQVCEDGFDSTKGYPGEGPRTPGRSKRADERVARDLGETEHSEQTRKDRAKALVRAEKYLEENGYDPIEDLRHYPDEINSALALFVQHLYDKGSPLSYAIDALLGLQDLDYRLKGKLALPWKRVTSWERGESPELRSAIPPVILRACITLALMWNWQEWASTAMCMYQGIARPGEIFSATWAEVYFTREMDPDDVEILNLCLIRVKEPKTRWKSARQQTVIVDDPECINYLRYRKSAALALTDKLWGYSPATWQNRFLRLQRHLGIPKTPYTAACLRAGGATAFYLHSSNIDRLRIKGRWSSMRSLDHYIQESTSLLAAQQLPPRVLHHVQGFARLSTYMLYWTLSQPPTCGRALSAREVVQRKRRLIRRVTVLGRT